MTMTETYEGWANRETWAANLWFANDEGLYREVLELAGQAINEAEDRQEADYNLADTLKDWFDGLTAAAFGKGDFEATDELKTMIEDIGSAWRIDWDEIATHWVTDELENRK